MIVVVTEGLLAEYAFLPDLVSPPGMLQMVILHLRRQAVLKAFVGELMRLMSKARWNPIPHICSTGGVSYGNCLADF